MENHKLSSTHFQYEEILTEEELDKFGEEFAHLKDACYLDHSGATLYAKSQIDAYHSELRSNLFSNPHSRNPSSSVTTDAIDCIRTRILRHFGTNEDDYSIIFTSGATSAMKLLVENFCFNGGLFAYLEESHTSVVGMRELVSHQPLPIMISSMPSSTNNKENQFNNDIGVSKVQHQVSANSKTDPTATSSFSLHNKSVHSKLNSQTESIESFSVFNGASNFLHTNSQPENVGSSTSAAKIYCLSKDALEKIMESKVLGHGGEYRCKCWYSSEEDHERNILSLLSAYEGNGSKTERNSSTKIDSSSSLKNSLMVYPAQCNFSGKKYPLSWIHQVRMGHLNCLNKMDKFYIQQRDINVTQTAAMQCQCQLRRNSNKMDATISKKGVHEAFDRSAGSDWFVLLDAASYVATSELDLSKNSADFVAISFYKMFGFPTGLGALLVRNKIIGVLKKKYFGGGTVNIALPWAPFHVKRSKLHERFEDGTIPFLSILALNHGFDTMNKLCRSINTISTRTFKLAQYFYKRLSEMHYSEGRPVAEIYSDTGHSSQKTQGPVVAFNLLRWDGTIIGYSEMEQMAYVKNVHLRYGCFCNPGACRRHLKLHPDDVVKHYEAGHVCGDMRDLINGKPTGAIRVSFGYMTTQKNIDTLLNLIHSCWISPFQKNCELQTLSILRHQMTADEPVNVLLRKEKILRIFVYPIKSCAPFEVFTSWNIGHRGLLYDREWLIINSSGVPLTQKREPRLCHLKPTIDTIGEKLILSMEGHPDVTVPLKIPKMEHADVKTQLCSSKVCGDVISGISCGEVVNNWISHVLNKEGLQLIRMPANGSRKPRNSLDSISLANQSQYLLVSMSSLIQLAKQLIKYGTSSSLLNTIGETSVEDTSSAMTSVKSEEHCFNEVIESLIRRFRSNFVIGVLNNKRNQEDIIDSGRFTPYEEETWDEVKLGNVLFKCGGPCMRCATICTNQMTGQRGSEPFLTLSSSRGGLANFGIHLYRKKSLKGVGNQPDQRVDEVSESNTQFSNSCDKHSLKSCDAATDISFYSSDLVSGENIRIGDTVKVIGHKSQILSKKDFNDLHVPSRINAKVVSCAAINFSNKKIIDGMD